MKGIPDHNHGREPMALRCNHVLCKRCLERVINQDKSGTMQKSCPFCNQQFESDDVSASNSMTSFIDGLPAMNEQLKRMQAEAEPKRIPMRQCVECEKRLKRPTSEARKRLEIQFAPYMQILPYLHEELQKKIGELEEKILNNVSTELVEIEIELKYFWENGKRFRATLRGVHPASQRIHQQAESNNRRIRGRVRPKRQRFGF
ncbi:unnamed protein product, partial [Mesorhabditis belari]|uniref:Zinc finger C3HC4 RING-type domain-containing protein n=1 Tax=Mesorhabditis belari TaxID=2138241 RepID=A0AAF3J9W5_9BILA